jgi:hypothetical protein
METLTVGSRHQERLSRVGQTPEGYEALWNQQDGKCAICGHAESVICSKKGEERLLAQDHDHETGMLRGLLCTRCNIGIGYLQDNSELLRAAAEYLYRHGN